MTTNSQTPLGCRPPRRGSGDHLDVSDTPSLSRHVGQSFHAERWHTHPRRSHGDRQGIPKPGTQRSGLAQPNSVEPASVDTNVLVFAARRVLWLAAPNFADVGGGYDG